MGLLRGMARTAVVAGTATAVSNRVSRRQASRWAQEDEQQSLPTEEATDTQIDQLERLGRLRDKRIITDEEFSLKKQQILHG